MRAPPLTMVRNVSVVLLFEQLLNGLQLGVMLFLLAAGLTLIFGIMGVINLAHGSLYMIGAYAGALLAAKTGSFWLAMLGGLAASALAGIVVELLVLRRLYHRDHLDQVLATFAIILTVNQGAVMLFGRQPLFVAIPPVLSGAVDLGLGFSYPVYRLAIIGVGLAVAMLLSLFITRTRAGMLVRAGATHRDMVRALGVDIGLLFTLVFGLGALLAGLAGLMAGPLLAVQVGMGEQILILTFVVVAIGGLGSVRGAFFGAMIVGMVDTMLRAFLPTLLRQTMGGSEADALGSGLASMGVYLLMATVLLLRPKGLFPAHG
ncbi:LivH Branched-chain amino acid ABC-type transport system, permease components [Rhabdaerophilaceae bacterium]